MTVPGLILRHLAFLGPAKRPAILKFGAGFNVIYGASDTGKSFIVEVVDFMLGGGRPLRPISERVGYDRVLLGIESSDGELYTLQRSADGGRFKVYSGLLDEVPKEMLPIAELADQHSDRKDDNLSSFLLKKLGVSNPRIRKNKSGETISLSFRHLARLTIVTENEITEQRSPLTDGNPTTDTSNFASFKFLLTGVDDSALVAKSARSPEEQTKEAQIEVLEELLADYRVRLKEVSQSPKDLEDQLDRLDQSLAARTDELGRSEVDYKRLVSRRRELREKYEEGQDRNDEIGSLLERFGLLSRHYESDKSRLKAIEEAGTLFVALGPRSCPLCGASPQHQGMGTECEGNVEPVVAAARSEFAKIDLLHRELTLTLDALKKEHRGIQRSLPRIEEQLRVASAEVDEHVSTKLAKMRAGYAELADKRGEVREGLAIWHGMQDIERRRADLDKQITSSQGSSVADGDLPTSVADEFSKEVEAILTQWHFPGGDRVYFDAKERDLVINGKLRTSRGKGLRAVTHAAFTLALMEFCRKRNRPHPGFVLLDSPLLAYRAPEGTEEDLTGTDLKEQFYAYLVTLQPDRQVIIFENTDPPADIITHPNASMFTANPHSGRYGFFPVPADLPKVSEL